MNRINSLLKQIAGIVLVPVLFSCNDYLDREPLSQITPDYYLTEESQLASYINNIYPGILPSTNRVSTGTEPSDGTTVRTI